MSEVAQQDSGEGLGDDSQAALGSTAESALGPTLGSGESIDPALWVRPELRQLSRYHLDLSPCLHKLDQNEVPYDLPRTLKRRVAERFVARSWADYPDFHSDRLRQLLAQRHGWSTDGVLVGNGSNELLGVTLEAVAVPGGEVVITLPSFGLYPMFVRRAAATPHSIPSADNLQLPMDALIAEVEKNPQRPVILCSPNNPTGDAAPLEAVETLLQRLQAPLLLDNAYGEFSRIDYRPLLRRYRNLILFRTFSKAWSLGGLRLGYLLADPALVAELMKVKLPYNVGLAHALAAEAVLEAPAACERRVRVILGRRPQWQAMLEGLGFEVLPSQANFLLARVGSLASAGTDPAEASPEKAAPEDDPAEAIDRIRRHLESRGIRVRDVSKYPGLSGCMRVSVGSGRALRDTQTALEEILQEKR